MKFVLQYEIPPTKIWNNHVYSLKQTSPHLICFLRRSVPQLLAYTTFLKMISLSRIFPLKSIAEQHFQLPFCLIKFCVLFFSWKKKEKRKWIQPFHLERKNWSTNEVIVMFCFLIKLSRCISLYLIYLIHSFFSVFASVFYLFIYMIVSHLLSVT